MQPWKIRLPKIRPKKPLIGVSLLSLVYGFAAMIAVGTILLMLPVSSNAGQWTSFINCLFTATSAVCVTGLAVVDTLTHWSFFGQFVILVLIQLGGLGITTSTTILMLAAGRKIGLRGRILVGESVGVYKIGGIIRLARNIALFTFAVEIIGGVIFYLRFSSQYEWPLSVWKSVFHTISSFNNCGFDIFTGHESMAGYINDFPVILTTAILVILGGISFIVINDIFNSRGLHYSSLDTKLVILITGILIVLGTAVVFATEYGNPQTLGGMSLPDKIMNAFFQSTISRTAGFSSFNTGGMAAYTLFFTMILMFIGGAAGSTAGGIKVNTLGLILITVWETLLGREHPGAFGREFPVHQIFRALTLLVLALGLIALVFFILSITEPFPSLSILFETVSAFGTVGLSTGITPELSIVGKVVVIIAMFIGRLGPLTLSLSLARTQKISNFRYPQDSIRIG